jgi:hypothetical protein
MVLVKPATVIQWHRKGFRLYWRWRSRHLGRPKMNSEIRELIRQMSVAIRVNFSSLNPLPIWHANRVHDADSLRRITIFCLVNFLDKLLLNARHTSLGIDFGQCPIGVSLYRIK